MSSPSQTADDRLAELVFRWSDDSITDAEVTELEGLLHSLPDGARTFAELTGLDQSLISLGPSSFLEDEPATPPPPSPRFRWSLPERVAVGALALLAIAVIGILFPSRSSSNAASRETEASTAVGLPPSPEPALALLTHSVFPKDDEGNPFFAPDQSFLAGDRIELSEGVLHLEFLQGVNLVVEGPASLQLTSSGEIDCQSGRYYLRIPRHAGAFTISTPFGQMEERQAEFAVHLSEDTSEVHVFSGEVIFKPKESLIGLHLVAGQASNLREPGPLLAAQPDGFLTPEEVRRWAALQKERALSTWQVYSLGWRRSEDLLAYYDFDAPDYLRGVIPARTSVVPDSLEGVMVGLERVDGRWPGKGALSFDQPTDRLRVELPGHHDEMTLIAWIRPEQLTDSFALLTSDGFEHGAVHWSYDADRKSLSLRTRRHTHETATYESELPSFLSLTPRTWVQVACTYDRLAGEVVHYVDASPLGRCPIQVNVRLKIGLAEIGNASALSQPFQGIIDEFAVFSRVLTDDEIATSFSVGSSGLGG